MLSVAAPAVVSPPLAFAFTALPALLATASAAGAHKQMKTSLAASPLLRVFSLCFIPVPLCSVRGCNEGTAYGAVYPLNACMANATCRIGSLFCGFASR